MSELPKRYRIINWLIRWTGCRFAEDHLGRWHLTADGGAIECRPLPLGTYSLRRGPEVGLRDNATNIERFMARQEPMTGSDKLHARFIPFSSIVGGGLQLLEPSGRARFQIALMGTTDGITKEENSAIATRLAELINQHGLEVPKR